MKSKDIIDAIYSINPIAEFTFNDTDLDTLQWHGKTKPLTKEQILAAFENNKTVKAQELAQKAVDKAALLDRLGITEDEAKLLLS
jgi:hypothetical protein